MAGETMTGDEIRKARCRSGLGVIRFAAALGIGKSSLDRFERGVRPVPRKIALAVAGLNAELRPATEGERI